MEKLKKSIKSQIKKMKKDFNVFNSYASGLIDGYEAILEEIEELEKEKDVTY